MVKVSKILLAAVSPEGWFLPSGRVLGSQNSMESHADIANRYLGLDDYFLDGEYEDLYKYGWIRFYQEGRTFYISTSKQNLTDINIHNIQKWVLTNGFTRDTFKIDIDQWAKGNSRPTESILASQEDFMCANSLRDLQKANELVGV